MFWCILQFIVQLYYIIIFSFCVKTRTKKPLTKVKEPNVRGEHSRNSDYFEGEPSRTASQPEEQTVPPDFPANVQLHLAYFDFYIFRKIHILENFL